MGAWQSPAGRGGNRVGCRRRVLVVCAHFRRDRSKRRSRDFLQPISGLHVASQIDASRYEIRLHHEDWHGPYDTAAAESFDLVFLSGLQADFDRMRQLSYHFGRRGSKVVAGGSVCSLFPEFAAQFFDAVCAGGVEGVRQAIADYEQGRLRKIYRSPQSQVSSYRLEYRLFAESGMNLPVHLVESSRGCSFRCDFCVIPAEGVRHTSYSVDMVAAAIDDAIATSPLLSFRRWFPTAWFLDNNFSDNPIRMRQLCGMLRGHPRLKAWGALVTQNVLRDRRTIDFLARSRCRALFVGLESLDQEFLRRHNKKQNISSRSSVIDDILYAERLGICVTYAYLFDPRYASVEDMRRQIATIVGACGLPMPAFISFIEPLAGTKFFWDCAAAGELRPNLRLRDLDGETVAFQRLADTPDRITAFAHELTTQPKRVIDRLALLRSTLHRIWNGRRLSPLHWYVIYASNHRVFDCARSYVAASGRSYLGGVDALDPQYAEYPASISESARRTYFEPVRVTDEKGALMDWLEPYAPWSGAGEREVLTVGRDQ